MSERDLPNVLIVEDERPLSLAIAATVESCGGIPNRASTLAQAREAVKESSPAAIVLDIGLPDGNGLTLLSELKGSVPVLVVTAHGAIENAIEARKQGVYEFFDKPIEFDTFRKCLSDLLSDRCESEREVVSQESSSISFIGAAPAMRPVFQRIAQACTNTEPVLVVGDTGTGKSTVARLIAEESKFSGSGEIIDWHSSFGEGESLKVLADHLVIVDPITRLNLEEQERLVNAMADSSFAPSRVIATAGNDLRERVESGSFLSELYYRLQVLEVKLPNLSQRKDDVPALADFFLGRIARGDAAISTETLDLLMEHDWPGNLRELKNTIVYLNTLRGTRSRIEPTHLPEYFSSHSDRSHGDWHERQFERALDQWLGETSQLPDYKSISGRLEQILIERLLDRFDGKLAPLARALNANRTTLRKRYEADL